MLKNNTYFTIINCMEVKLMISVHNDDDNHVQSTIIMCKIVVTDPVY